MDFEIHHLGLVGSTMDEARNLVQSGCPSGTIVIADEQNAGRGRIEGRTWSGSPGASLLMTLALEMKKGFPAAPALRVGLGVLDALSSLAAGPAAEKLRIKWPNDIMGRANSREPVFKKLAGILCESSGIWLLAGIGLNLTAIAYPPQLVGSATNLADVFYGKELAGLLTNFDSACPEQHPVERLAARISSSIAARMEEEYWKADFEKNMWGIGEVVRFNIGHPERGEIMNGKILGIEESGRLLLEKADGSISAFVSGEIFGLSLI
jgi:BirA family transcriptional regulator, biotin operon repressor / biotin---[acetyl-CoA-carboxylase] ligase